MPDDPQSSPPNPPQPPVAVAAPSKRPDLQIIKWPDPRLRKKSESVATFDDALRDIAERMFELMRQHKGVGLAAPQVGINLRLFVANPTGEPGDDKVYVNPILTDAEGGEEAEEGCLSLPEIHVNVTRPTVRLRMQAQDLAGQPFEQVAEGFLTRIWQHETDHLNGVLIIDRMGPVAKLQNRKRLKELEEEYEAQQKPKKRPPPPGFPF
jgi:peptide deformylase